MRGCVDALMRRRMAAEIIWPPFFYASNAGGLAHVRSSAASIQTAEIPDQVRNDELGVDALVRGCVDASQESPKATILVLFSAPLKGELSGTMKTLSYRGQTPTTMLSHSERPLSRSLRSRQLPFQGSQGAFYFLCHLCSEIPGLRPG
jgi:hypothetical protein